MYRCKEVVLFVIQHVIAQGDPWCDKFGDATLHHLVHCRKSFFPFDGLAFLLRILKLVADGHSLSGTDEFWQISIEGMMREPGHLY